MKTRKKRIIRSLELDEVSAVGTPAQAGALHAITKSEPEPARVNLAKPLLSPELIASIRETEALKALVKSYEKESTMTEPTTDFETLTKHYSEKWDVTPAAAGVRLMQDRPDLVAKAYESSQAAYVAGIEARRKQVYGS